MDIKATLTGQEILVPLNRLRPSKRNVRKTGGGSVKTLARSIERLGVLQNLIVTAAPDGKHYEVEAGKRRLKALLHLLWRKRISPKYEVRCLLVPDASASTVSLAENVQRESLSPIDELLAWKALVDEGQSTEDIAADFGVTPLVVQRRLKLANVSPRLLDEYRKERITLDQLMALAITDDHRAQEAAFYEAPEWQREPKVLRERLTAEDVDAARDPVARFVGAAYEQAGGGMRKDLFADAGQGIYLTDRALLDRLAAERLAEVGKAVEAEGWYRLEVVPRTVASDLYGFQRIVPKRRKPTAREAKRIERLRKQAAQVVDKLHAEEGVEETEGEALVREHERINAELEAINDGLAVYSQKAKAQAGAVVTVDGLGRAVVHRGLVREADAKQARAEDGEAGAEGRPGKKAKTGANPTLSEKLARQLSAHRTAAIQAELAAQPTVALVAVVHRLALPTFYRERHGSPLQLSCTPQNRLDRFAPDLPESQAAKALTKARQAWQAKLPEDPAGLFAALKKLPQDELLALLAVCAAGCVDAVSGSEADDRGNELAQALGLDMAQWWTPTAAGYFGHVSKARIFEAIQSFAPKHIDQLNLTKKPELAKRAEELAAGTGWLPPMLRKAA
jgi:ParB family chromosome partitioning protein